MAAAGLHRLAIVGPPGSVAGVEARPGSFADVVRLPSPASETGDGSSRMLAVRAAEAAGCDWMIELREGEILRHKALELAAPAVGLFDAIFGGVRLSTGRDTVWRPSRLAFDEAGRLPHALLQWWIGDRPLVRTAVQRRIAEEAGEDLSSKPSYLFRLWAEARCIKLAAPLVDVAEPPPALDEDGRSEVLERLRVDPVFFDLSWGSARYRLPYTGRNAGIEREQTRGLFFEAAELEALRHRVGPGARIADIGANTGNHTVYFAGPMQAATVIPFEPLPELSELLSRTVAENGLANVDLSRLGVGVADRPGRARIVRSNEGGLGASRLEDDDLGDVEVVRLDDVLTEPVDFLKIDVESMELQVLAGAVATIDRHRPVIFVEIANANTTAFMHWLQHRRYGIERIFSDKGHANYLIAPDGAR